MKKILILLCFLLVSSGYSQKKELRSANKFIERGEYTSALDVLESISDILQTTDDKTKARSMFLYGMIYTNTEDFDKAVESYQLAKEIGGSNPLLDAEIAKLEKNFWIMQNVIINKPNKRVIKIDEYTLKTNLSIKKIEDSFLDPQSLSVWKIPNFILLLKESGFSATKHQMYLYKTILLPVYLIGLILIAGSFTIKFTKTKTKTFILILMGVITGFLIHVLGETIYSLGIANKLNTWVASLSPSIITIMIGGFFVIHFEKTG